MAKDKLIEWIEVHASKLIDLSDEIWEYAEPGLHENQSAQALIDVLRKSGFEIEEAVAGMPSAFVASYGKGKPVVGIMGEYDALPGLSQKKHFKKEPHQPGAAGHACGHNLLGVAAVGGVLAIREFMEQEGLGGTIKFFGCPAEETLVGKVFMVRDGFFDDVDVALTWHPASANTLWAGSSLAMNSAKFTFHGRSSHAAGDPENGRSALDAVELMNIGANYLREHIVQDARIHYVITNGGGEPNIVPPIAEVWYYVRAPQRKQVEEVYQRLVKIAEGATLMTETTFEIEFLTGCYNTLHNYTLGDVLMESMHMAGAPRFDREDITMARKLTDSYPEGHLDNTLETLEKRMGIDLRGKYLFDEVVEPRDFDAVMHGSTDVGDVSWVTPTAQFTTACNPIGTPGHSWQYTAASGMGMGHKGMLTAAKVLALSGWELLTKPQLVDKAKTEFKEQTKNRPYKSPLPKKLKPPLHMLQH